MKNDVPLPFGHLGPGPVEVEAPLFLHGRQLPSSPRSGASALDVARPGDDRPFSDGEGLVRNDFLGIHGHAASDAVAIRTHALRRVEGKEGRRQGRVGPAAAGARLAERYILPPRHVHQQPSLAELEALLHGVGQALFEGFAGFEYQPIHHDLDGVLLLLGQFLHVPERLYHPVDAHPRESLALELLQSVAMFPLAILHDRGEEHDFCLGWKTKNLIHHRTPDRTVPRCARRARGGSRRSR